MQAHHSVGFDPALQPTVHGQLVVLRAPTQVWSAPDGAMGDAHIHGATYSDVRIVRAMKLTVGGREPEHLVTMAQGPDRAEIRAMVRGVYDNEPDPDVLVTQSRAVDGNGWTEIVTASTRLPVPLSAHVQVELVPDATYMDAIKMGTYASAVVQVDPIDGGARWSGEGVSTTLSAPEFTVRIVGGKIMLDAELTVPAKGGASLQWRVDAVDHETPVSSASGAPGFSLPSLDGLDPRLRRWATKAFTDLDALRMTLYDRPDRQFLAAGAPWYFTLFGRDSLWAARMLLPTGLQLATDTLYVLAGLQGSRQDPETAEDPGKVIHELRRGELFGVDGTVLPPTYYGTVDATPLWVCLLHDCWKAGMSDDDVRALLPHAESALTWMRDFGDVDGDGLLEYIDRSGHGLTNQGWKDSHDGVQWNDGRLATGPVALCEVQAYAYEAASKGAELLEHFGGPEGPARADEWRTWASNLRTRFNESFWITDSRLTAARGSYPAIALDAEKRAVDSLTSNLGHLLGTGILDSAQSARVAEYLGSPEMNSGYGLRTMSTEATGYWPLSYHGGAVWPHDTAIAIAGLVGEGHWEVASSLIEGLLVAAEAFGYRIPELYSGEGIDSIPQPVPYPAACRPQAWSAAASFVVVNAVRKMAAGSE